MGSTALYYIITGLAFVIFGIDNIKEDSPHNYYYEVVKVNDSTTHIVPIKKKRRKKKKKNNEF